MKKVINSFTGKYHCFSNFSYHPFILEDKIWYYNEIWYQVNKTFDEKIKEEIIKLNSPGKSKRYWKDKEHLIRPDWYDVNKEIMFRGVYSKFYQNEKIKKILIETDDMILIEGNTWGDTFWGVCNGVGENNLGKTLMNVREILR